MEYPEKPVKRNNTTFKILMICAVSVCTLLFNGSSVTDSIAPLLFCIFVFLSARIVLCLREIILYRNYSYLEILSRCIEIQHWGSFLSVCLINIALPICLWSFKNGFNFVTKFPEANLRLLLMCGLYMILGVVLEWYECPLTQSYKAEESFSLNGGSRMASGFYYGYLQIILPDLVDLIKNYQSKNNIEDDKIPVHKLFILIPSDAYVPDKLIATTPNEHDIEVCEASLEAQVKDRAMVKDRVYKNTIYKIRNQYYVALEGATSLKTFYETCDRHPNLKRFKKEVVSSFYYTLERFLSENRDLKDLVELVYYNNDCEIEEVVYRRLKYILQLNHERKKHK